MSHLDLIADHSKEKLVAVPKNVLDMNNLKMLFLEGNFLTRLPDDLFWKLPRLMWLDLRNNLLQIIPTSIAFHEHLENLLLSNNNLEKLPNELGTVKNLKALQVTDNPLTYPPRSVLVEGTKVIKNFLKIEYEKQKKEDEEEDLDKITETEQSDEEDERFIRKIDFDTSDIYPDTPKSTENIQISGETEELKTKISDQQFINPDLEVKKLLPVKFVKKEDPVKIIHKVSSVGSKIYLKSSVIKGNNGKGDNNNKNNYNNLKDGWLNELRILLNDQERILQQERNLRAIATWRLKRKSEYETLPKIFHGELPKPPYDTDPDYNKMPTREELAKQLLEYKNKGFVRNNIDMKHTPFEIQKMIRAIMEQLKQFEIEYDPGNPTISINQAEQQIKTMMDIQKKLMSLKSINDATL